LGCSAWRRAFDGSVGHDADGSFAESDPTED
jgi:hypothetical protein